MRIDAARIDAARRGDGGGRRPLARLGRLLTLCVWLFVGGGAGGAEPAEAPSLEAYRGRIACAREILRKVNDALDARLNGFSADDEREPWRLEDALPPDAQAELRRLLPERTPVATPTGVVVVNNRTLHAALDELCAAEDPATLRDRLRTLDAQLDMVQAHLSATPDGEAADIRAILAREAFQPIKKTKTPLQHLQSWLVELIDKLFKKLPFDAPKPGEREPDFRSGWWVQLGLWIVLTLLLSWAAVWFMRRARRPPGDEDGVRVILGEPVGPDVDADALLAQARAAADAGDWRQAVRKVYIALLHDLDKRAIVSLNPAWTNREYLNAVRAQGRLYPAMRELTDRFDVLWYGRHPGDRETYEQCLSRYYEAQAALSATA